MALLEILLWPCVTLTIFIILAASIFKFCDVWDRDTSRRVEVRKLDIDYVRNTPIEKLEAHIEMAKLKLLPSQCTPELNINLDIN